MWSVTARPTDGWQHEKTALFDFDSFGHDFDGRSLPRRSGNPGPISRVHALRQTVEVIPNVWSAIGQTGPSTYENAGHNNNLSFIVTGDGVVVINGGGGYLLAKALHDEIRRITKQPVKLLINENGQGHAMLGNSYWAKQGRSSSGA